MRDGGGVAQAGGDLITLLSIALLQPSPRWDPPKGGGGVAVFPSYLDHQIDPILVGVCFYFQLTCF